MARKERLSRTLKKLLPLALTLTSCAAPVSPSLVQPSIGQETARKPKTELGIQPKSESQLPLVTQKQPGCGVVFFTDMTAADIAQGTSSLVADRVVRSAASRYRDVLEGHLQSAVLAGAFSKNTKCSVQVPANGSVFASAVRNLAAMHTNGDHTLLIADALFDNTYPLIAQWAVPGCPQTQQQYPDWSDVIGCARGLGYMGTVAVASGAQSVGVPRDGTEVFDSYDLLENETIIRDAFSRVTLSR